jgi:hypothetical protein
MVLTTNRFPGLANLFSRKHFNCRKKICSRNNQSILPRCWNWKQKSNCSRKNKKRQNLQSLAHRERRRRRRLEWIGRR